MGYRGRLDDPGVMEGILNDIRTGGIEFWLDRIAHYENEKPGDFILPGVPPKETRREGANKRVPVLLRSAKGKKRSRNTRVAA